jgi:hypothetical protein
MTPTEQPCRLIGQDRNAIAPDDGRPLGAERGQRDDPAGMWGDRESAAGPEDAPGDGRQPGHKGVGRSLFWLFMTTETPCRAGGAL